ncbi:GAMM1 protein [Sistotremastrum niveocremeum HHB9708]|uniref:GAMM1 protein n=1 Tax=Sistotremastrum niveocremeum HHB9708 TaxID=1314777 RepID=A0A164MQX4_9AGAM|nr:GAMM1 protein [Sistotremastrum niveocremeum HHB9708]
MSTSPDPKRARTEKSSKVIGTHNGSFHCDEALAVFLLRLTDQYKGSSLIRTRDSVILDKCDVVVDVGAVYDVHTQRFDHHQRGFGEVFGHGFTTKLSSAGLIYKHFGEEIIASRLGFSPEDARIQILYLKLYAEFIEGIDAIDNGIEQYDTTLEPKYKIRTDLSSRVGWLNPPWNKSSESYSIDDLFLTASNLTGTEFLDRLDYYGKSWLPARDLVATALQSRASVHPSQRIAIFDVFAPWKEHLFDLETELKILDDSHPYYVLYPDEFGGTWRIQAVPVNPASFQSRLALPEDWRGVRDDDLSKKTGVPGCVFVHASGFIGGNKTREGALEMASIALKIQRPETT